MPFYEPVQVGARFKKDYGHGLGNATGLLRWVLVGPGHVSP